MSFAGRPDISDAFARQAKACADMGAPFTSHLGRLLDVRLDRVDVHFDMEAFRAFAQIAEVAR